MKIYPAIDIIDGKCVRLIQGDYNKVTVYSENPVEIAKGFKDLGADFLHIVDLEGARSGKSVNHKIISEISKFIKVQTGGGIRTRENIENILDMGIERVIVGTAAINLSFLSEIVSEFKEKIVVGIDAKNGRLALSGWEEIQNINAVDFAKQIQELGVKTVIYTDISTDGMLKGPNLKAMTEMAGAVRIDVIASGGVSCFEDLLNLEKTNVKGVIIGKAIYEKRIDLKNALDTLKH